MPDVTKQRMTAEELRKARLASEQMGDIEFQMEIAPYFDYAGEIDPSIARYRGIKDLSGDVDLNLGGFYVSPEDPNDPYDKADLKPRTGRVQGVDIEIPVEPGTVSALHTRATPNIWAHEYRHQMGEDGNGERYNRLADAVVAQNEGDWESAVKMWRDQIYRDTGERPTASEAQEDLLDRLRFNNYVTPRGVYRKDYERGARGTAESGPSWWERESANYEDERMERALWRQKDLEMRNFDKWNEGLSERNQDRGSPTPPPKKRKKSEMTEEEFEEYKRLISEGAKAQKEEERKRPTW